MLDVPAEKMDRRRFLVVFPADLLTDEQAAAIEHAIQHAVAQQIAELGLGIEMADPRTALVPRDAEVPWWVDEFKGGKAGQFPLPPPDPITLEQ